MSTNSPSEWDAIVGIKASRYYNAQRLSDPPMTLTPIANGEQPTSRGHESFQHDTNIVKPALRNHANETPKTAEKSTSRHRISIQDLLNDADLEESKQAIVPPNREVKRNAEARARLHSSRSTSEGNIGIYPARFNSSSTSDTLAELNNHRNAARHRPGVYNGGVDSLEDGTFSLRGANSRQNDHYNNNPSLGEDVHSTHHAYHGQFSHHGQVACHAQSECQKEDAHSGEKTHPGQSSHHEHEPKHTQGLHYLRSVHRWQHPPQGQGTYQGEGVHHEEYAHGADWTHFAQSSHHRHEPKLTQGLHYLRSAHSWQHRPQGQNAYHGEGVHHGKRLHTEQGNYTGPATFLEKGAHHTQGAYPVHGVHQTQGVRHRQVVHQGQSDRCAQIANPGHSGVRHGDARHFMNKHLHEVRTPMSTSRSDAYKVDNIATGSNKLRQRRKCSERSHSTYCHICQRLQTDREFVVCANLKRRKNKCRKIICKFCCDAYGWPFNEISDERSGWLCPHCTDSCPERSQCYVYERTNSRRRAGVAKKKIR